MTRARVLSFHIDEADLPGLTKALDGVSEMFAHHEDFRGLVCLEHEGPRNEIVVMTFWDGTGLDDTQADSEVARQRIAATTDLGVSSKSYVVLRMVSGPAWLASLLAESLAS
jgi:hypothetical protein